VSIVSHDPFFTFKFESSGTNYNHAAFLRFITSDGYQFGFPFSQLLQFVLEPHSDPEGLQQLLLSFSSYDVKLSGFRLHLLCDQLDQGLALRVQVDDTRFANDDPSKAFVAEISVKQL